MQALALLSLGEARAESDDLKWLDAYNVVWTSQSKDSSESMPCGGGYLGMNVWVENGELLCYLQRSGSLDENHEYLKLGRLRVRLEPNPFAPDTEFRQELKLREGYARYLPLAMIVAGILLAEMIIISLTVVSGGAASDAIGPVAATAEMSNVESIGRVLYTD